MPKKRRDALAQAIREDEQRAQQAAYEKAILQSQIQWWERQAALCNKLIETLPHPSIEPGSDEHFQHRVKAIMLACFGICGRYEVPFEDVVKYGREFYDMAVERKRTAEKIKADQSSTEDAPKGSDEPPAVPTAAAVAEGQGVTPEASASAP
jgi:hypothetical protein